MRVQHRIGKAVALALLSISAASCAKEDSNQVGAEALGSTNDPQVRAFYGARGGQAAWDRGHEKQLIEIIGNAPTHGLRPELFLKGDLPKDRSEREAALTRAALRYASALAEGYSDPRKLGRIYTIPRPKTDVAAGLASALAGDKLTGWFDSLPPQTSEYRTLSAAFMRYLKLANEMGNGTAIQPGKAIKPGRSDPRLPAIANALAGSAYLEPQQPPPQRYTPALVAAVKNLQMDYGLKPDGIIGADTIKALNEGPGDRARQLAVNLERLRWVDRNPPGTRIDVNTGGAYLEYWRGGALVDRRKVVVGELDWETPQIASPMIELVAHPYWRVPDSIYEDELKDKGPAYFAEQRMVFKDGKLIQLPGPKNSLGDVKFDMRNDQQIYLHDTPFKELFSMPERHRSHGCIRVEDAMGFAFMIASDDGILPKFQEAMAGPDEKFVKMKTEIPVRLMYRTAFVEQGQVKLVDDVYGWDDDVAYALGYLRRPPRPHVPHRRGADVGP